MVSPVDGSTTGFPPFMTGSAIPSSARRHASASSMSVASSIASWNANAKLGSVLRRQLTSLRDIVLARHAMLGFPVRASAVKNRSVSFWLFSRTAASGFEALRLFFLHVAIGLPWSSGLRRSGPRQRAGPANWSMRGDCYASGVSPQNGGPASHAGVSAQFWQVTSLKHAQAW